VAPWTKCRTRLSLRPSGSPPAAGDPANAGEPPTASAGPWHVALEEERAGAWQSMQEWSFAEEAELERSLAALGLRREQVASLRRDGQLELG
jgi:hypothetical protein